MSSSYRDLIVWQSSFVLTKNIYEFTRELPQSEAYGLVSQMQRCAVSIPSNIAEGQQRGSAKEFKHFLHIARGSAAELSTQLQLASEIYNLEHGDLLSDIEQVQKMLYALMRKL